MSKEVSQSDEFTLGIRCFKEGEHEKALNLLQSVADNGHIEAQYVLGLMYATGLHNGFCKPSEEMRDNGNKRVALQWFWKAADNGHENALWRIRRICQRDYHWHDMDAELRSLFMDNQKRADSRLEKLYAADDVEAQFKLACLYLNMADYGYDEAHIYHDPCNSSHLRAREKERRVLWALRLLHKTAGKGHVQAQLYLGHMYKLFSEDQPAFQVKKWTAEDREYGIDKDSESDWKNAENTAAYWFEQSASAGNPHACYALGAAYENREKPVAKSAYWYRKAVEHSEDDSDCATTAMSDLYSYYGASKNLAPEELIWLRDKADAGNSWAMLALARIYLTGKIVARDEAQVANLLRKLLEQSMPLCRVGINCTLSYYFHYSPYFPIHEHIDSPAYWLGCQLLSGRKIQRDETTGANYIELAAKRGCSEAKYALVHLYRTGTGVERDDEKAMDWLYSANLRRVDRFYAEYSQNPEYKCETPSQEWMNWPGKSEFQVQSADCLCTRLFGDVHGLRRWLEESAAKGNGKACYNLACLFLGAKGIERNPVEAFRWFKLAVGPEAADASWVLKRCYESGIGTAQNKRLATLWRNKRAEAHLNSGDSSDWDWELITRKKKGIIESWLSKRAEQGNIHAKAELAMREHSKNKIFDAEILLAPVKEVALNGSLVAQEYLGRIYMYGEGVPVDYEQAARWLRMASENDAHRGHVHYFDVDCTDPKARLGLLYREGKGVEQDHAEAARLIWPTLGASNFHGSYVLGMAYECGLGVEKDSKLARRFYEDEIIDDGSGELAGYFLEQITDK